MYLKVFNIVSRKDQLYYQTIRLTLILKAYTLFFIYIFFFWGGDFTTPLMTRYSQKNNGLMAQFLLIFNEVSIFDECNFEMRGHISLQVVRKLVPTPLIYLRALG